ncbi:MAG TPA: hypothetical protein VMU11_04300 [Verrucomicrobiae bacterium]|nr:hypothetical protein [Verrucomicrobiae bacterium]
MTSYKYRTATCLEESLTAMLCRYPHRPTWTGPLSIVSVPPSERRLRERGIDQAARIADLVRDHWFPEARRTVLLARTRHTAPNAQLDDPRARRGNMAGAFAAVGSVRGSVVLVDDVYTSGATTGECARVLREAGAQHVYIVTLAKG